MFRTDVSTHIFKTVNQRRDNMEQAKGKVNLEQAEYAQAAMKVRERIKHTSKAHTHKQGTHCCTVPCVPALLCIR